MSSETPQTPPEELEASLTALLLGELPHAEAAALHQRLAQDPDLAQAYERLKRTIALVRETVASPAAPTLAQPAPLKLSAQRRSRLLQEFKTVRPPELARPGRTAMPRRTTILLAVAASLAILGLLASLALPVLSRSKSRSQSWGLSALPSVNMAVSEPQAAFAARLSPGRAAGLAQPSAQVPSVGVVGYVNGLANRPVTVLNNPPGPTTPGNPAPGIRSASDENLSAAAPEVAAAPAPAPSAGRAFNRIVLPTVSEEPDAGLAVSDKDSTVRLGFDTTLGQSPAGHAHLGAGSVNKPLEWQPHQNLTPRGAVALPPPLAASTIPQVALTDDSLAETQPSRGINIGGGMPSKPPPLANTPSQDQAALRYSLMSPPDAEQTKPAGPETGKKENMLIGDMPMLGKLFQSSQSQAEARMASKVAGEPSAPPATLGGTYLGALSEQDHGRTKLGNVGLADGDIGGMGGMGGGRAGAPAVAGQLGYHDASGQWNLGTGNGNLASFAPIGGRLGGGVVNGALQAPNTLQDEKSGTLAHTGKGREQLRESVLNADTLSTQTSADSGQTAKSRAYFEAKQTLDDLTRSRQQLAEKLLGEKTDSAIPKRSIVELADKAVPESPSTWEKIRGALGGSVERSARVRVERDEPQVTTISGPAAANAYDPYFIQTEFELIRSEEVLGRAVDKLNLEQAWAKQTGSGEKLSRQEAVRLLRNKLDVNALKDSGLLSIGAKADNPADAAKLANAVAEAYQDVRTQQRQKLTITGIAALSYQWAEQNQRIQLAQADVERLRRLAEPQAEPPQTNAVAPSTSEPDAALPSRPKPSAAAPIPQPEIQTCDNAFSTFSLNVSDVSFKLAAASLEKGVLPDPANIRSEEFINAFDYRDPEAPPGVPVAFAWERAAYPFAQNRDLLRFSLKTAAAGREAGRPMNIVLLLDNSGSMERADRVRILQEALRVLAAQLQPQDKFSVVTFSRTARLRVDGIPGDQAPQAAQEVAGLTPEGGTNLEDAMNLAYQTALRHYLPGGINRVVLLTDGAANLGDVDPDSLKQKVEANRKQGIALDCFGIGWEGYNDDLLEVLSRNGDGRYGFINTPEEAVTGFAAQLAGALHVAAADVKVQVEFNPNRVTAYRQIGYAKHQLTKEQFRDNTVDAAELGAAEAGNALYVIEANPQGDGPLATVRVRYKVPGTTDYREQEWTVPYTGSAVLLDQANPALRLAATASAFSEWLAASPYAAEVTPDRLLDLLSGVPETYGADPRPKQLKWMLHQAQSLAGK